MTSCIQSDHSYVRWHPVCLYGIIYCEKYTTYVLSSRNLYAAQVTFYPCLQIQSINKKSTTLTKSWPVIFFSFLKQVMIYIAMPNQHFQPQCLPLTKSMRAMKWFSHINFTGRFYGGCDVYFTSLFMLWGEWNVREVCFRKQSYNYIS